MKITAEQAFDNATEAIHDLIEHRTAIKTIEAMIKDACEQGKTVTRYVAGDERLRVETIKAVQEAGYKIYFVKDSQCYVIDWNQKIVEV